MDIEVLGMFVFACLSSSILVHHTVLKMYVLILGRPVL